MMGCLDIVHNENYSSTEKVFNFYLEAGTKDSNFDS